MLKLTKETSSENYPISPQTSAVRKLSVKTSVKSVADLKSSYCIVKNNLSTSVNGSQVVRNVSWGCYFNNDNIVEYPATCQIQYAELKIGGQSVEYVEDVNVRLVNLMTYQKNSEQVKKQASLGSYGFQRLENGAKAPSPASATSVVRSVGAYRSPFLQQTLDDATSGVLQSSVYQEVATVIKLSDLFSFCQAMGVDKLNLMGREVEIILQFEDRKQILTEFVNYKAKYDATAQQVKPTPNNTLAIDSAFFQYVNQVGGTQAISSQNFTALTLDQLETAQIQIRTLTKYKNVVDCPLYVGMPICLWKTSAVATVGANYFLIKSLTLDANSRCLISIVPYFAGVDVAGQRVYIQPAVAGTTITTAQIFAELATANATPANPATFNVVSLSGVCDPVVKANTITVFSSQDNGLNSLYYVNGFELVVVEKDMQGMKQTIEYVSYMRDSDVIPAGALNYTKSFQIDPSVSAVFAMFPPVLTTRPNDGDVNLLSCSRMLQADGTTPYTNGLVMRNMLNGNPLYTRDIVFGSSNNDSVEPLYFHRLYLVSQKLGMQLNNLSTVEHFMAKDGVNQHAMICEPIPVSQNQQLFTVRLQFLANTNPRTIYLYKAQMRTVEI